VLVDIMKRWAARLGAGDRVPANLEAHLERRPHSDVVRDAGFEIVGHYELASAHEWTVPTLLGFMYSTSVLNREVLGDGIGSFETDLHDRLVDVEPSGRFADDVSFAYDLAHRAPG